MCMIGYVTVQIHNSRLTDSKSFRMETGRFDCHEKVIPIFPPDITQEIHSNYFHLTTIETDPGPNAFKGFETANEKL